MPPTIDERTILESLRQVPGDRWGEVLSYIESLSQAGPTIRTAGDLLKSGLVGLWADRDDIVDNHEFARQLGRQAGMRGGSIDADGR